VSVRTSSSDGVYVERVAAPVVTVIEKLLRNRRCDVR